MNIGISNIGKSYTFGVRAGQTAIIIGQKRSGEGKAACPNFFSRVDTGMSYMSVTHNENVATGVEQEKRV